MSSIVKGLTSDFTGSADICRVVRDFSKSVAADYILPGETIFFALQSSKEEFAFTSQGLIASVGETATTTRKLVTRYDYKTKSIQHVEFESTGRVDRDCEIKFKVGGHSISIDIAKDEIVTACMYYKVIELISRQQHRNARNWDLAKTAMGHAAEAMRLSESSGMTLMTQSDAALGWLQTVYDKYNPRCYREVIQQAFQDVQTNGKMLDQP